MHWDDIDGSLLASPFLNDENLEISDKCLWIGGKETDTLWTDYCDVADPWQLWNFKPVNGNHNTFQLVNKYTPNASNPFQMTKILWFSQYRVLLTMEFFGPGLMVLMDK